jgi:hypothetical protein
LRVRRRMRRRVRRRVGRRVEGVKGNVHVHGIRIFEVLFGIFPP